MDRDDEMWVKGIAVMLSEGGRDVSLAIDMVTMRRWRGSRRPSTVWVPPVIVIPKRYHAGWAGY
jgi:hypothetical protein